MSGWPERQKRRYFGLREQLLGILCLVALLAAISAVLVLFTLGRVEAALRQISAHELERFSLAHRLSSQAQALVAQVPSLVRAGSEAAIESARVRVEQEILDVTETVRLLGVAGAAADSTDELRGFIENLKTNVAQLEQVARRRLQLEQGLHRSHHRLEVMRQALAPSPVTGADWGPLRLQLYELWAASFTGVQLTDPVELQDLMRQVAQAAQAQKKVFRQPSLPAEMRRQALASLDLLAGEESPLKLRLDLLRLSFLLDTRLSVNGALSDRFLNSAAELNQAAQDSIRQTSADLGQRIQRQRLITLVALGAMGLGVAGVWVFASLFLVRRLRLLLDAVQAQREGQAQGPLPALGHNEVGDLARELQYYLDLLAKREAATLAARDSAEQALEALRRTQDQLVQSERLVVLGQLVANVAHEINTPIAAVKSSGQHMAEALERWLSGLPALLPHLEGEAWAHYVSLVRAAQANRPLDSTRAERARTREIERQLRDAGVAQSQVLATRLVHINPSLEAADLVPLCRSPVAPLLLDSAAALAALVGGAQNINVAVEQVTKIVFALKSYSRNAVAAPRVETDLREGLETVLTLYHNQIKRGVELHRHYAPVPPLLCWPDELNQVWTNLIHNALQAMHNRGRLEVSLVQQGDELVVSVRDSGPGIAPELQQRIFEPFFTTKARGEGSGLGLDIVRRIVEKHGGQIRVESSPGEGAQFSVHLPLQALPVAH